MRSRAASIAARRSPTSRCNAPSGERANTKTQRATGRPSTDSSASAYAAPCTRVVLERRVERGGRGHAVGLPVDDHELTVGCLEQEVDEALEQQPVDLGGNRHLPPRPPAAVDRGAHDRRGAARARPASGSRPRGRRRPRPAAWARAVASIPAPVARSTVWRTACTARPTAVPARPAPATRGGALDRFGRPLVLRVRGLGPRRPAGRAWRARSPRSSRAWPRWRAAERGRPASAHAASSDSRRTAQSTGFGSSAASSGTPGASTSVRRAVEDLGDRLGVALRLLLAVEADDQVVAGAGHRDVEQPEPFRGVVELLGVERARRSPGLDARAATASSRSPSRADRDPTAPARSPGPAACSTPPARRSGTRAPSSHGR